ncbi:hypothetical protein [Calothrix sp. PCC 6303]|uniref:hypothetical protein n=1 Tax=Calothrix sp. PCC 6303 TaxID=1170562 RepID=UPI0002A04A0C|nr:hypothetical protein [Calothrix sp. PCC 6303]AFZ03323.1 hypothetical protein Cal6303_4418 [Calothrix sp. PCC 6303]
MLKKIYCSPLLRKIRLPLLSLLIFSGVVADRQKPVFSNQIDSDPYSYTVALRESAVTNSNQPNLTPELPSLSKGDRISSAIHGNRGNIFANEIQVNPTESYYQPQEQPNTKIALLPEPPTFNSKRQLTLSDNYPTQDGVYLYGQSPQPGENGQGYVVFEKRQNKVTGAMYMPNSEYSCFEGTVDNSGELAMTVEGSAMDGVSNEIAVGNGEPVLDDPNQPSNYAYNLALRDYHRLESVSDNDRQILQACR